MGMLVEGQVLALERAEKHRFGIALERGSKVILLPEGSLLRQGLGLSTVLSMRWTRRSFEGEL
jgi:hypothetical protein